MNSTSRLLPPVPGQRRRLPSDMDLGPASHGFAGHGGDCGLARQQLGRHIVERGQHVGINDREGVVAGVHRGDDG